MNSSLTFLTATRAVAQPSWRATPVRDHSLEVLGHDRDDKRIYLVDRAASRMRALPELYFVRTQGWLAGRITPAYSWYMGDPDEVARNFAGRLDALLARLKPLVPMAPGTMSLRTRVVKRRAVKLHPQGEPLRRYELHLAVRPTRRQPSEALGRGTVTAYLRPRASIERVLADPQGTFALAMISYVGIPDDIGYLKEAAILVPLRAPAPPSEPER